MKKHLYLVVQAAALLSACGGGGGSGEGPAAITSAVERIRVGFATDDPAPNALRVVVDQGPPALVRTGRLAVNTLFVSVTVCTPGSTNARRSTTSWSTPRLWDCVSCRLR